jgi:hypothetical protein
MPIDASQNVIGRDMVVETEIIEYPGRRRLNAHNRKVLLAVKNMGGESEAAWRMLLDDLANRGLKTPELAIVDGAPGLEKGVCRALERHAGAAMHGS